MATASSSSSTFLRQLRPAAVALVAFTVLFGVAYPLVLTGVGQVAFHDKANGSLVHVDGKVVGSTLIGQGFAATKYFHPRPSAAGTGYDGEASSGSNMGPTNPDYLATVQERAVAYRQENGLAEDALVPTDAVTASASGLDPHISLENAQMQAARVAAERDLSVDAVMEIVHDHIDDRPLGVLGDPGVNVLEVNLALDGARR